MSDSKSCGPNIHSIPTRILKECRFTFSNLLSILINKSYNDGHGTISHTIQLANPQLSRFCLCAEKHFSMLDNAFP